ncbi:MAG TPA: Uma2 family endonuclease [Anaerolineae bacterium]|nr:Uma2 family endonuclease [Anaerolineae bacterium]HIQ05181.1 Uma2 family endonuclease [Anaerolineae bacterium]
MSYEEFLAWADEDTLAEWVDGEAVMYSPASKQHQLLVGFLEKVLGLFVGQHNLGIVLSVPFQMELTHGREPDLLFVAQEHLDRLKDTYLDSPADLVVEIVSPESVGRDRGEKFYEYARGGVPEYWLINPQMQWAEFYWLEETNYRLVFGDRAGEYRSSILPDFWLQVEWLWQEPLPSPGQVVAEITGLSEEARRLTEAMLATGEVPKRVAEILAAEEGQS